MDITQSPFSDYTLKCVLPMLCHADDVIPEIERPGFSALPEGDYPNVQLVLTEESFHQSCGTWSTVMGAETSFSIDASKSNKGKGKGGERPRPEQIIPFILSELIETAA